MGTNQPAGWTPIYDGVAGKHGIVTAAVFGIIWRYCQMRDHVCRASIANLAARLNINRVTMMRHIDLLQAEGLIRDLSPELRNRPHIYVVTKQAARLMGSGVRQGYSSAEIEYEEEETDEDGDMEDQIATEDVEIMNDDSVNESDSSSNGSNRSGCGLQQPTVSESDMNQTLIGDSIQEDEKNRTAAKQLWRTISAQIEPWADRQLFAYWAYRTEAISWDQTTLILGVPSEGALKYFLRFMVDEIHIWLVHLTGAPKLLKIIVLQEE